MKPCPCMSGKAYAACCELAHQNKRWPLTAEDLMRSRYSAYVIGLVAYIVKTTHPKFRSRNFENEISEWMASSEWSYLEILETNLGSESDEFGEVEFVAEFKFEGQNHILHENSNFVRYKGRWVYTKGEVFSE